MPGYGAGRTCWSFPDNDRYSFHAAAGTTVGHELVHRTRQPLHLVWGRWLLGLTFDASFAIEHVHGHHAKVSTFEDPASARRGEGVYGFILRSTRGQLRSAWRIEGERLARKGEVVRGLDGVRLVVALDGVDGPLQRFRAGADVPDPQGEQHRSGQVELGR